MGGLFDRGNDKKDDAGETAEGKASTGDEVSRGGSNSSSPHDFLVLGGEEGGEPIWMPSASDDERFLLAMKLAVGFI